MTFNTDKIDIWVYIVVFIFIILPSAWKKVKTTKESIKDMLDIKDNEECRKKEHDEMIERFNDLESKLEEAIDFKTEILKYIKTLK